MPMGVRKNNSIIRRRNGRELHLSTNSEHAEKSMEVGEMHLTIGLFAVLLLSVFSVKAHHYASDFEERNKGPVKLTNCGFGLG